MPTDIERVLVWVDRPLAIAAAAKMAGVLRTKGSAAGGKAGLNWLVSTEVSTLESDAITSDIRELLPEELMYHFYSLISMRPNSVDAALPYLTANSKNGALPGAVVSVPGRLSFPGLPEKLPEYSPYSHVDVAIPTAVFHGETTIVAKLSTAEYSVPVFLGESARHHVLFCNNQPVEVTGILRWVPPYSPGGARSCNLAIRCFALWLR